MAITVAPSPSVARRLSGLLALAVFINYVDRGNLATAAPVLATELHLSATQIGILLSSFYWTYAISQLGAGWLAERFPVGRVIAAGFAIWSVATILTGLVSGFVALLCLRLVLGLGESVAFPCSSKMLAEHVSVDRRGRSNASIALGIALGPAFGTYVGGEVLARFGWRALFLSLGAVSLIWLVPWLSGPMRTLPARPIEEMHDAPSFLEIVRQRPAIGAALGHFTANYIFYFVLSWLPFYLVKDRGYSLGRMAVLGGLTYLMHAAGALATGYVTDRAIERGETPHRVYKTTLVASQISSAACLLGVLLGGTAFSSACLLAVGFTFGLASPTLYAVGQLLAGPKAAGRWIGFQGFVGNLAGIAGPAITGFLVDSSGSFYSAFVLAIVISLVGVLSWTVIVPRIAPVQWSGAGRASYQNAGTSSALAP
jgi:MFS family permease